MVYAGPETPIGEGEGHPPTYPSVSSVLGLSCDTIGHQTARVREGGRWGKAGGMVRGGMEGKRGGGAGLMGVWRDGGSA